MPKLPKWDWSSDAFLVLAIVVLVVVMLIIFAGLA